MADEIIIDDNGVGGKKLRVKCKLFYSLGGLGADDYIGATRMFPFTLEVRDVDGKLVCCTSSDQLKHFEVLAESGRQKSSLVGAWCYEERRLTLTSSHKMTVAEEPDENLYSNGTPGEIYSVKVIVNGGELYFTGPHYLAVVAK